MMNHINLMGRLTKDPELRQTTNGISAVNFTLAVESDYTYEQDGKKKTDFINIVAWRNTAEFVGKYFHKGSPIAIDGRLQTREWTDKDGNKRTAVEVVAEQVYFAGGKPVD